MTRFEMNAQFGQMKLDSEPKTSPFPDIMSDKGGIMLLLLL
jgi:hypothetical protein